MENMKIELPYYKIGDSIGGNQDWFSDPILHIGGCAAVTACDLCILLAWEHGKTHLYPFDCSNITKEDFLSFGQEMKPYLHPGLRGVDTLEHFIAGLNWYFLQKGELSLHAEGLAGDVSAELAAQQLREQTARGIPTPFLLLKHKNPAFKDYVWHWFLLAGVDDRDGGLYVRAVTYGESQYLPFDALWETGYTEKGGIILLREESSIHLTKPPRQV